MARVRSGMHIGEDEWGGMSFAQADALITVEQSEDGSLRLRPASSAQELSNPRGTRSRAIAIDQHARAQILMPHNTLILDRDFALGGRANTEIRVKLVRAATTDARPVIGEPVDKLRIGNKLTSHATRARSKPPSTAPAHHAVTTAQCASDVAEKPGLLESAKALALKLSLDSRSEHWPQHIRRIAQGIVTELAFAQLLSRKILRRAMVVAAVAAHRHRGAARTAATKVRTTAEGLIAKLAFEHSLRDKIQHRTIAAGAVASLLVCLLVADESVPKSPELDSMNMASSAIAQQEEPAPTRSPTPEPPSPPTEQWLKPWENLSVPRIEVDLVALLAAAVDFLGEVSQRQFERGKGLLAKLLADGPDSAPVEGHATASERIVRASEPSAPRRKDPAPATTSSAQSSQPATDDPAILDHDPARDTGPAPAIAQAVTPQAHREPTPAPAFRVSSDEVANPWMVKKAQPIQFTRVGAETGASRPDGDPGWAVPLSKASDDVANPWVVKEAVPVRSDRKPL